VYYIQFSIAKALSLGLNTIFSTFFTNWHFWPFSINLFFISAKPSRCQYRWEDLLFLKDRGQVDGAFWGVHCDELYIDLAWNDDRQLDFSQDNSLSCSRTFC
jgi:hypothetical protein